MLTTRLPEFPMEDGGKRLDIFEDWNREIDQKGKVHDHADKEFESEYPQPAYLHTKKLPR